MKCFFSILAVLALLFFFSGKATEQEADPNQPWLSMEPAGNDEKEAQAEDPRSLEDRIRQSDYCAAGDYFRGQEHRKDAPAFLAQILKNKPSFAEFRAVLESQFAVSRDVAISTLRNQKSWQAKAMLALRLAGIKSGAYERKIFPDELQQALVALDEAEEVDAGNSLIPIYRALVMQKQGTNNVALVAFLKQELSKRKYAESPMREPRMIFRTFTAQNPLYFAAALRLHSNLFEYDEIDITQMLSALAATDREFAKVALQFSDQWQVNHSQVIRGDMPELPYGLASLSQAMALSRKLWGFAYPGVALPMRYSSAAYADIVQQNRDRSPSETALYLGFGGDKACDPKWKEAVTNDTELLRDRLRQFQAKRNR